MQFLSFLRSTHSRMKQTLSNLGKQEGVIETNTSPTNDLETDLKRLARGAYSGLDNDFQGLLGDSRSTLKRLTRGFFPDDVGDKEPYAKNVYKHLYKTSTSDDHRYTGLSLPADTDNAFDYALGGARAQVINDLMELEYGGLDNKERETRVTKALQKAYQLDERAYINRPGVGPVLSVIGQATKEVTIDIFQLQNKMVSDALVEKAKQGVNINIRVAMPDGTEKDATGFTILGPNMLELEKFQRVKEDMERNAEEAGGPKPNINLFVADKKSHPKVILTENEAILGTLNLTQPVGSEPLQAGANYEAIRRLSRGLYTPDTLTGVENTEGSRSAKLYYQLRSVYHTDEMGTGRESRTPLAFMEQTGTRPAFTAQDQVVGPGEIYQELRYALDLAGDTSAKQWRGLYAILNQPFLLMLDDPMHRGSMQGEMGKFPTQNRLTDPQGERAQLYRETQRRLFDLINQDRAFITVDNRGYIEKVIEPMYQRLEGSVQDFGSTYRGDIKELVHKLSGGGAYQDRLARLTQELRQRDGSFDTDTARQLMAMAGGNIKLSTATMQHVKSFAVMEGLGPDTTALSYYMGSSNLGAYSLSMTPDDVDVVNREIGVAFSNRVLGKQQGPFSLSAEEISSELQTAKENFSQQWVGLTHTYIGNIDSHGSKAWYESRVHSKGLMELNQKLKAIGKELGPGFTTHYIYGGDSGTQRVGVEVGVDIGKLSGTGIGGRFNLRYSVLEDIKGGLGFVYDLSTSKVISNTLLQNSTQDKLSTPYGTLDDKQRYQILDPISTAINLISTFTAEGINRVSVWGPQSYIKDLSTDERLGMVLDYMDMKVSGKRGSRVDKGTPGMFFLHAPATALEGFSKHLEGLGISSESNLEAIKRLQQFIGEGAPEDADIRQQLLGSALGYTDLLIAKEGGVTEKHWEMVRGGAGEGVGVGLANLLDTSPELLLDVVTTLGGPSYESSIRKGVQEFRDSLMEPFLYQSDISKYSGSQGWHRLSIYEVTEQMAQRVSQATGGMGALLSHALMVPNLYDPSSDLGINEVWRSIASKSTINEGLDELRGATLYGRRGSQVGDVMHSKLGVAMGVGYESHIGDIQKYLTNPDELKVKTLLDDRFRGQSSTNTYIFDTKGKLASIPQRLKNVGGQKGLVHMTQVAQEILDIERGLVRGETPQEAITNLRAKGNWLEKQALSKLDDRDLNLVSYMGSYTQTLREEVGKRTPDASHLITDDMGLAAIYGGKLRTLLGPQQLTQLESYASQVEGGLGQEVDDVEKNLAYYVLQAKAVTADMLATGEKGYIAGRVDRPLVLLQMSGAYSDHFYANKDYGGGVREGFVETKTVRLRANKLGSSWMDKSDGLLAQAGDLISYDRERNQVLVLNARGLQKRLTVGQDISSDEVMTIAKQLTPEVIDDRSQVSVLDDVIESLHRGEGSSTAREGLTAYSATRQGEDAIDYLLSVKALPGVTSTGNMEYEFTYASSIRPGGGRRVEGAASAGLFKAVSVMSDISSVIEERVAGLNDGLASSIDRVDIQDVFGIVNASNLKSFFYQHGAGILRDAKGTDPLRMQRVMDKSSGRMVAGLLMHFGDAWVGEADAGIAKLLTEFLERGELGEHYKSLASGLLLKHKGDREKVGRELLGHKKSGGGYVSDLDKYNITQLPGLANLNKADIMSALGIGGDNGALAQKLGGLVGYEGALDKGKLSKGRLSDNMRSSIKLGVNLDNPLHRQASILLTSWDITAQLSSQTLVNTGELWLGKDKEGDRNLLKVASVMGFDPLRVQRGLAGENSDTEYSEMARNIAMGLSSRVSSVFLEMDLNYSVTKEPSGKKKTGNIEGVQMVKPFLNLGTEFRETGSIGKLKLLLGNLMAGMTLGDTATGIAQDLHMENTLDGARNLMDPMDTDLGNRHKFLGLYGSGVEGIEDLKLIYADYEETVKRAIEQRLTEASNKSTLILGEQDPLRKQTLETERGALLQEASLLMLESEDPRKVKDLLGAEYKAEYDGVLERVKAIGERYDALSSKPMGVGLGNAIVKNMAHDRGVLYLPQVTIEGQDNSQVIIRVDASKGSYSYLPSGEDLGFLGAQYGAHVDEIVMASIRLTGAMTPGTSMNKVMQKLKLNSLVGNDRIALSQEEAKLLHEYQETFIGMNTLLAEKGAGSRLQAATGGKVTLKGGVTTPTPSWWVPEGSVLLSKETLRKQGENDSLRAKRYVDTLQELEGLEDKPDNRVKRTLLKAQADALLNGLSEAGMYLVQRIRTDRDRLTELESYHREAKDRGDFERALSLHKEARNLIEINLGRLDESTGVRSSYRSSIGKGDEGRGDTYAVRIGELEMEYFIQAFGDMDDLSLVTKYSGVLEQRLVKVSDKLGALSIDPVGFDRVSYRSDLISEAGGRWLEKVEKLEGRLEKLERVRDNLSRTYQTDEELDAKINRLSGYLSDALSEDWESKANKKADRVDRLVREYEILTKGTLQEKSQLLGIDKGLEMGAKAIKEGVMGLYFDALQGKARGELNTFSFDKDAMRGLSPQGKGKLVKDRLANLISQYQDLDRYLEGVEKETYSMGEEGHKLLTSGVQRANLKELISTLGVIGDELDTGTIPVDTSITKIERVVNTLDSTELLQTITFRNAPFGSTETQRQAFSVLSGIDALNEYIERSRGKSGIKGGITYDTTRNQTLTMLNPLSHTTLNLGDFDGDPYTSIFTSLAKFHKEVREIQDVISTHKIIISEAHEELRVQQERYQALGPSLTEQEEKALLIARSDLTHKVDTYQAKVKADEERLSKKLFELERAKATHTEKYGDAIRQEVANYLGVDKRLFTSKQRGGFLEGPDDVDLALLPTFLQQGHGLFGGLKDKAPSGGRHSKLLEGLTEAYVSNRGDLNRLMQEGVLTPFIGEDNWKVFRESEAVRDTLMKQVTQITAGVDLGTPDLDISGVMKDLRPLAQQRAGMLTGLLDTQSKAEKLMQKAMGASISTDMYGMLTKVLGKAGGDILGRTYNTLVGTLFADSPLIALGHLLTSNEGIRERMTGQLTQYMERKISEGQLTGVDALTSANQFMDLLEGESVKAQGLQQFMKNAQQLLRDSLKFKKANDTLDKLAESLDKYNSPDIGEQERRDLISGIAGQLGPGPGLRAFMQLEELVNQVSNKVYNRDVIEFAKQEGGEDWDTLAREFGVSKANLYDPNAPSDLVREMQLTRQAFNIEPPGVQRTYTVRETLEYKVARDLQNLIAANRMGLSEDTGTAWYKTLMQGASGLLDDLGIDKVQGDKVLSIDERTRLAFEGGDDRARVRMTRAQQVMEPGWYEKGPGTEKLVALLSHIESSFTETQEAFGIAGERLKRMSNLRVINKGVGAMAAGKGGDSIRFVGEDPDLLKGDVLTSMLQLSASNKLTPEASSMFMSLLGSMAGPEAATQSKLDLALSIISPKDKEEANIFSVLKDFLGSEEGTKGVRLGDSKALFEGGIREYIEQGLESTSTWARGSILHEFIQSVNQPVTKAASPKNLFEGLLTEEKGVSNEGQKELVRLMREQLSKQAVGVTSQYTPTYRYSTPEAEQEAISRSRERVARAVSTLQDRMDLGAGVGVALISSLLLTGGVSAETAKEAAAGTLMAVGYSKANKGGWLGGIGGGFRMRMAAMEGAATGQAGTWVGNWVMRETLFTLGAMAGNVLIEKTELDKKLVKGIARVFGADLKPMDFDKYANWRGASATIAGALLSALMGSVTSMVGVQLASGVDNFLPLLGALDNAAQASREMQRQSDERVAVLQAEGVDLSSPDDPLIEALNISYEILQGNDDRLFGDFEVNNASLSYNDSDVYDMPEAEVMLS